MRHHSRNAAIVLTILSLVPLALLVYGYLHRDAFLASQEAVRLAVEPYGAWAPLAFVALQILQVVLTPINHYVVGLAGGFLFGPLLGSVLNYIGRTIGHILAFAIARHLARPIIDRYVSPEKMAKYDKYVSGSGFLLFLAYFLPVFPDDELSYIAGASKMPWKRFLIAVLLGQIGGSVGLAVPGAGLSPTSMPVIGISLLSLAAAGALFWAVRKRNKAPV